MSKSFKIADRQIGADAPCYIIAEVSCNHEGDFDEARRIIESAADCGVDAVKLQTYTAATMTLNVQRKAEDTMWKDIDLYSLYEKAHTPWDWYKDLKKVADDLGVHIFSTPFDETALEFLVEQDVPVLKLASFEVVDLKLVEEMAKTGLPVIMSNGMTDYLEMEEAVRILRDNGTKDLALLHCNSGYPASFDEANLKTIPVIEKMFDAVPGLSDHTIFADDKNYKDPMPYIAPLEAVRLGAKIIEVHLMLDREKGRDLHSRNEGGFDWAFSREPAELKKMVDMIRLYEKNKGLNYDTDHERAQAKRVWGEVRFDPTEKEIASRRLRPSLWVSQAVKKGDTFKFAQGKEGNFDSFRPADGLHIRFADFIAGQKAARDIEAGEPLSWDMVQTAVEN